MLYNKYCYLPLFLLFLLAQDTLGQKERRLQNISRGYFGGYIYQGLSSAPNIEEEVSHAKDYIRGLLGYTYGLGIRSQFNLTDYWGLEFNGTLGQRTLAFEANLGEYSQKFHHRHSHYNAGIGLVCRLLPKKNIVPYIFIHTQISGTLGTDYVGFTMQTEHLRREGGARPWWPYEKEMDMHADFMLYHNIIQALDYGIGIAKKSSQGGNLWFLEFAIDDIPTAYITGRYMFYDSGAEGTILRARHSFFLRFGYLFN